MKAATKQLKVERDVAVTERDVAISERDAMHAELTALRAASSPPTNDQLIDMFEKHSRKRLKTGRHYTVEGYEAFRDLVCGAGLPMQQVNHVINVAFKLLVGREVDFKISRTPVRTAIMALGVCDDLDERLADSGRKHQLIFDESAHILLIASAHWNHELRRPELTVLAAIRLDKQTGQILAEKVHDGTSHIPADSIISTLSDNCKAMDGVYKGAMVCLFHLLKSKPERERIDVVTTNLTATEHQQLAQLDSRPYDVDLPDFGSDDSGFESASESEDEDSDDGCFDMPKMIRRNQSHAAKVYHETVEDSLNNIPERV